MPTDPLAQARREGIAEGLEMAAKVAAEYGHPDIPTNAHFHGSAIASAIRALKDGGSDATR